MRRRCDRCCRLRSGWLRSGRLRSGRLGSGRLGSGGLLLFRWAFLGCLLRSRLRLLGGFLRDLLGLLRRFLGGLLRRFLRGFLLRRYNFPGLFGLLAFLALLRFSHRDPPVAADPCLSSASKVRLAQSGKTLLRSVFPLLLFSE